MHFQAGVLVSLMAMAVNAPGGRTARLEIGFEGSSVVSGETPKLMIRVRNTGSRPLWVNTRFALNSEFAAPDFRDLWLSVVAPDAKRIEFDCKVKGRLATRNDYQIVEVDKSVERIEELGCFDITVPGTYRITAKYRDGGHEPPAAPARAVHLKEELESAPVELTVLPKAAR
jgi:hypothetical protein